MKCQHVRSVAVEYAEGGLCVADELCVDIHLIQCESCRAELAALAALEEMVARELEASDAPPDTLALLDRIDSLPDFTLRRERSLVRSSGVAMLRAALTAIVILVALSAGAATWQREVTNVFGLLPAEAAAQRPLVETIRPLTSDAELNELRDLNELTDAPAAHPTR
jgi:predicted anti-sigma-YlaC factor YlaD